MRWTEKYRPKSIDEIVGNPEAKSALKKYISCPITAMKHLLLVGPAGVGKTSVAMVLRKDVYMPEPINLALYNGKEDVHKFVEQVNQQRSFFAMKDDGTFKGMILIWNEADTLTKSAQKALNVPLESVGQATTTKVIMTVNDVKKFNPTFLDRVEVIAFYRVNRKELRKLADKIIKAESLEISEEQINQIIGHADGSPRKMIDDLQSFYMDPDHKVPFKPSVADLETDIFSEKFPTETFPSEEWEYHKAVRFQYVNGGEEPIKWVFWTKNDNLPKTVERGPHGMWIEKLLKIKTDYFGTFSEGLLNHIKHCEDDEGKGYVKLDEEVYTVSDFIEKYADGNKQDWEWAIEAISDIERLSKKSDPQASFEKCVIENWLVRDSKAGIKDQIEVKQNEKYFKVSKEFYRNVFASDYGERLGPDTFAIRYGYSHNTTTLNGKEDVPCIYGNFAKIDLVQYENKNRMEETEESKKSQEKAVDKTSETDDDGWGI